MRCCFRWRGIAPPQEPSMQTSRKPWQDPRFDERLEAARERTQQLLNAAIEHVILARELRQTAGNLRQENRDFRDFLRENSLRRMGRGGAWAKASALQS